VTGGKVHERLKPGDMLEVGWHTMQRAAAPPSAACAMWKAFILLPSSVVQEATLEDKAFEVGQP
jgi:hypothetical protein